MRFSTIYIDPPWKFDVWDRDTGGGRSAEAHYPTMTNERLLALPLQPVMERDCAVFMWATWATLPFALACGTAWGLEYKTCAFLWAKTTKRTADMFVPSVADDANWHIGMGYYSRANTEPVLLFTKGSPRRKNKGVRQLLVAPIEAHSRKPDETYTRIERLMDTPASYLEVFARRPRPGWVSLGNEISGRDIYDDLTIVAQQPSASPLTAV